ncbi:MAG: GNAT family N-acetyltransferase [Mycobacteriaceae bacterium]
MTSHPLEDPVLSSLLGRHQRFAQRRGRILRYDPDVAPFIALASDMTEQDWLDLWRLAGPGQVIALRAHKEELPQDWQVIAKSTLLQFEGSAVSVAYDGQVCELVLSDVPQMLDLIARTKPGPFSSRTIELGRYFGIKDEGKLIAMAGERMKPQGWSEISAVCTDPKYRGKGLANKIIRVLSATIRDSGDIPFLHATDTNTSAISVYQSLGFKQRSTRDVTFIRLPK